MKSKKHMIWMSVLSLIVLIGLGIWMWMKLSSYTRETSTAELAVGNHAQRTTVSLVEKPQPVKEEVQEEAKEEVKSVMNPTPEKESDIKTSTASKPKKEVNQESVKEKKTETNKEVKTEPKQKSKETSKSKSESKSKTDPKPQSKEEPKSKPKEEEKPKEEDKPEPKPEKKPEQKAKLLDVPLISQYPELPSGCEVTALAMALAYYGIHVDKTTLADNMIYDDVPIIRDANRVILQWGDPEVGYVGDPYGLGITINPNPLSKLANQYRPNSIPLYGKDFSVIEKHVKEGKPTLVWFTLNYQMPISRYWVTDKGKQIYAPRPLHCIVVTGVDDQYVYFNDSDAGKKNVKVSKKDFIKVYNAMGQRALVIQ